MILVGYASTPEGERALEAARREARLRGAALHVVRYLAHEVGETPTGVRHDMELAGTAEAELAELRERLAAEGITATSEVRHGLHGQAGRALLDAAREVGAELIVIGVRRRSAVGKLVLGSVAQDVLLGAEVPVLAVKGEHRDR